MSDISRREVLRNAALAAITGAAITPAAAQHVHTMAAEEKAAGGAYTPKALTAHEFATLQKLSDYIVPADESGPGALAAGAADWIDLMASENSQLADIYSGGIAWLDQESARRFGSPFLNANGSQQTELLDLVAYKENRPARMAPGIKFFAWARRMVVDAYYTSPVGTKAIGYMGNKAVAKFEIPPEALEYALKRSPV